MGTFPFYPQMDSMDCGPACLQMIIKHYGRYYQLPWLRSVSHISREGVSLKGISKAAEKVGFRTMAVKVAFNGDAKTPCLLNAPFPLIAHWNQNHFIVAYKANRKYIWIADPANGKHKLPVKNFLRSWESDGDKGIALLIEPTPAFYELEAPPSDKLSPRFFLNYLRSFRQLGGQLLLALVVTSVLALIFPFLTQAVVDSAIANRDHNLLVIILVGMLVLTATQTAVRFIQGWILLHVGTRLNVSLINDFLIKLMKLPLGFSIPR